MNQGDTTEIPENPKAAEKMAIKAHEYARQTYDITTFQKKQLK